MNNERKNEKDQTLAEVTQNAAKVESMTGTPAINPHGPGGGLDPQLVSNTVLSITLIASAVGLILINRKSMTNDLKELETIASGGV